MWQSKIRGSRSSSRSHIIELCIIVISSMVGICAEQSDFVNIEKIENLLKKNANITANHSNDFYEYACGNFKKTLSKRIVMPPRREGVRFEGEEAYDVINCQLYAMLSERPNNCRIRPRHGIGGGPPFDPRTLGFGPLQHMVTKAKNQFQTCLGLEANTKNKNKVYRTLYQEMREAAPDGVTLFMNAEDYGKWREASGVQTAHVKMVIRTVGRYGKKFGESTLFAIDGGSFWLPLLRIRPADELFDETFQEIERDAFVESRSTIIRHLMDANGLLYIDEIKDRISQVYDFRVEFYKLSTDELPQRKELGDVVLNQYILPGIDEMEEWITAIIATEPAWGIEHRFRAEGNQHRQIKPWRTFLVWQTYLRDFETLIKEWGYRTIMNHIHLDFLERNLIHMDLETRSKILNTTVEMEESKRWETCVEEHSMKHVLAMMYAKAKSQKTNFQKIQHMIKMIKETMEKQITRSKIQKAHLRTKKIRDMRVEIGYPSWYDDSELFNQYYEKFNVTDDHFENMFNHKILDNQQRHKQIYLWEFGLNEISDKPLYATSIYPRYVYHKNLLLVPTAATLPPFYDPDVPEFVNYARLGYSIAREMSRMFDNYGEVVNEKGEVTDDMMLDDHELDDPEAAIRFRHCGNLVRFSRRMSGLIRYNAERQWRPIIQHSAYARMHAEFTARQDFADVHGLRIIFETFRTPPWNESVSIRGFDGPSNEANFLILWAASNCQYWKEKDPMSVQVFSQPYSLPAERINSPVRNLKNVSDYFKWTENSTMFLSDKCYMWGQNDVNHQPVQSAPKEKKKIVTRPPWRG